VQPARKYRRFRAALLMGALFLAANEMYVGSAAERASGAVATGELGTLDDLWSQYDVLDRRSYLRIGVLGLQRALTSRTQDLAEHVIENYRSQLPTVREAQWRAARDALRRAVSVAPRNRRARAALRYCEGHLHRIDGEARKSRRQALSARREFTDAVAAFREAAELRPEWPDPFLGLMRTFIYGLEDIDRGADALAQAQRHGYAPGDRETTQLADGYRARGDNSARTARQLADLPQEQEHLERAAAAYRQAITLYARVPSYGDGAAILRRTHRSLLLVEDRLAEISAGKE
jgi:tetratricopeptide (TPR) repeat protein